MSCLNSSNPLLQDCLTSNVVVMPKNELLKEGGKSFDCWIEIVTYVV